MINVPFRLRKLKKPDTQQGTSPSTPVPHDPIATQKELDEKDGELLRIKSVFPFDFFPDELIIGKKTVSVIKRQFLNSNTETFLVKDIGLVSINTAILFSHIRISYKAPYEDIVIGTLWKTEAKNIKALLDKLMLIKNEDVDVDEEDLFFDKKRDMYYQTA